MGEGRERRRRGPVNRLRRIAYGLVLSASMPATAAELDAAPSLPMKPAVDSAPERVLMAGIEGFLTLASEISADPAAPIGSDRDYAHLSFEDLATELDDPRAGSALRITVAQNSLLREGLGFDVAIPDLGSLRLNLYARQNGTTEGPRATILSALETDRTTPAWSFGGSMELVRTRDGARQLAFVPELCIDASAITRGRLGFSAAVRYSHWRGIGDKESQDFSVPQLVFRWKL